MRTHVSLPREMAENLAGSDIGIVVRACGSRLGYMAMKAKQIEAITVFVNGKDTFIVLPTGVWEIFSIRCATTCI